MVLLRHANLFTFTTYIGWIGVDLFFVLSGFLVAGLLFKEYKKYGSIQPLRFLIRRGFKIYPIYYLSYPIYVLPLILDQNLQVGPMFADLAFIQNYANGWGYAYGPSWSLAVEEHFYFGLAFVFWWILRKPGADIAAGEEKTKLSGLKNWIPFVLLLVLLLRVASQFVFPNMQVKNFTMTHLRVDALLAGVYIAYLQHFKYEQLKQGFEKVKKYLWFFAMVLLAITIAMGDTDAIAVRTIGLTCLYLGFGIFLLYVLLLDGINTRLNQLFSKPVVDIISKVGLYSYSIYVIHTAVNNYLNTHRFKELLAQVPLNQHYLIAILSICISVGAGMIMTVYVENWFLRMRNRHFPTRSE